MGLRPRGGRRLANFVTKRYDLSNGFGRHQTFNRCVFRTLFDRWKHRIEPGEGFAIEVLSSVNGLDSRDRPFTSLGVERAGVFLAGQDLCLGIRLPA